MERWELPDAIAEPADSGRRLWAENGILTADRAAGAERLPGRFAYPGLVDCHFHMALRYGGVALGRDEAFANLRAATEHGVLLVRDMGAPGSISLDLPADPNFPNVIACGRQLAIEGGFIEGSHEPVPPDQLIQAALTEIDRGATWVKVLADWEPGGPPSYPMETLREMTAAAHGRGVRVAAHTQASSLAELLHTGVDSIEHGSEIDEPSLHAMAKLGIAWAPTSNAYVRGLAEIDAALARNDLEPQRRVRAETIVRPRVERWLRNANAMAPLAARLGVRLLASTDSVGTVADEVERFVSAGVDPVVAVGSATWDARRYLGTPVLDEGATADVVTFDADPRIDPATLHRPRAILLGGRRIR